MSVGFVVFRGSRIAMSRHRGPMEIPIDELIADKPHLADPLRFYEKAQRFLDEVRDLGLPANPALHSYPQQYAAPITERLASSLGLPDGVLAPLRQALELGEIDFTRLPLLEVPAFSLPYPEEDLTMLLYLISKPYFTGLRDACRLDGRSWDEGRCPVCNAQPSLTSLTPDGGQTLHCSFCGTVGTFSRVQCPVCLNRDAAGMHLLSFSGEEGFSVQTCDACKSYVKTADATTSSRMTPDLADIVSLPLDIVVQQKGYRRRSPNPLGMVAMSA